VGPPMAMRSAIWWTTWLLGGSIGFLAFFFLAFIAIGGIASIFVEDVEATLDTPGMFTVVLTIAFASAGAGLGLVQRLHLRRRATQSKRWIPLMAAGFGAIGFTYNLLVLAAGEAHLETVAGRAANELAHTLLVGVLFAWASFHWIGRQNGASFTRWASLSIFAWPATGLTVWALEVLLKAEGGEVNPLGMLVMGAFLGILWRPLLVRATSTPGLATGGTPSRPEVGTD
jgi:hypothetical protein